MWYPVQKSFSVALLFLGLCCFGSRAVAQSKSDRAIIYEDVEAYIGVKTYDENSREKRLKTIYIDKGGSYAYLVVNHEYLLLPAGKYKVVFYLGGGDVYQEDKTVQATVQRKVNQFRVKNLFEKTGSYLIDIFDDMGILVKSISLKVAPKKS